MKTIPAVLILVAMYGCATESKPRTPAEQVADRCLGDARAEMYMFQEFGPAWDMLNACRRDAGLPPLKP